MTTFLYKGYKDTGETIFGSKAFNTKDEMEKYLASQDIQTPAIFESHTKYEKQHYKSVSPKELSIFCKQISVMFFSYISIVDGIILLSEQTDNKQLKLALNEINTLMTNGNTFAESISMFEHIFGSYLIQMAFIGERSGTLDIVFTDLNIYFEKESEIRRRLKGAVIYPCALSILTIILSIYLIESVLPLFDSIITSLGAQMSPLTATIMGVSSFIQTYLILFLFLIIITLGSMYIYFSTDKGSYSLDKLKATTPYASYITRRITTARFSRSLSLLLKSGFDIYYALDQSVILIKNKYLSEKIEKANENIKNGQPLDQALFETDVFPVLFIRMVTIGEKTGNLDELLAKTSEVYEIEAYDTIDRTTKLIEPILITVLSIAMGLLLIAIMLPMISIMSSI